MPRQHPRDSGTSSNASHQATHSLQSSEAISSRASARLAEPALFSVRSSRRTLSPRPLSTISALYASSSAVRAALTRSSTTSRGLRGQPFRNSSRRSDRETPLISTACSTRDGLRTLAQCASSEPGKPPATRHRASSGVSRGVEPSLGSTRSLDRGRRASATSTRMPAGPPPPFRIDTVSTARLSSVSASSVASEPRVMGSPRIRW